MAKIDYSWLYPVLGNLAETTSSFLQYLIMSLGSSDQEALENMTKLSFEEMEKVVNEVEDLASLRIKIDTMFQEIKIKYSVTDILKKAPSVSEGIYEIAELIRSKYGEEPMWVFSTYGNLQIFILTYARSGLDNSMLRVLETNFDKLQLPRYQFMLLVRKANQYNEDPRPCIAFRKWFLDFRLKIMDMLVERKRSYCRNREDFNTYYNKVCNDEQKFTKDIFIPLLHCLGVEHIYYTHSSDEFGRDVVWSYKNPFGQERFCAAQIKALRISGAANAELDKINAQIDDAFKMPLKISEGKFFISEFYVVTSKNYTRNAIQKILSKFTNPVVKNNIRFLDGQRIKELVLQFLRPVKENHK